MDHMCELNLSVTGSKRPSHYGLHFGCSAERAEKHVRTPEQIAIINRAKAYSVGGIDEIAMFFDDKCSEEIGNG